MEVQFKSWEKGGELIWFAYTRVIPHVGDTIWLTTLDQGPIIKRYEVLSVIHNYEQYIKPPNASLMAVQVWVKDKT